SYAPGWPFGDREHSIGFLIVRELLGLRVPFKCSLQLFGDAPEQHRAGCPMRDVRVADSFFARAHAFQKVAGMAVAAVKMDFIGAKRFADDVGRLGNQRTAIHGDAASRADKTSATFAADGFARIGLAIDYDSRCVFVTGAIFV